MTAPRIAAMPTLTAWRGALALVVLVLVTLPLALGSGWQTAAISVLYTIYLCIAWNIIAGFAGQFALGQPVFIAIGAYTAVLLFSRSITPWVGMLAGAAISAAIAAAFGYLAFRYGVRGLYFALLTLASLIVAGNLAANIPQLGGAVGLMLPLGNSFANFVWRSRAPYYAVMIVMVAFAFGVSWLIEHSSLGWRLAAVRQDEDAAAAIGIDVQRVKVQAFVISAMLTSLAGTFYAQLFQLVSPETVLTFDPQITMFLGTYIGGVGTIIGPLVGGFVVGTFNQVLQSLPLDSRAAATIGQLVFATFLIAISLYAPQGLVGLVKRRR